jgi:catechol 2,3-dioxygenase-like lactoylglutathione lyase family enzyme
VIANFQHERFYRHEIHCYQQIAAHTDRANPPAGIEIGFTTDDVVATFAQAVAAGAIALVEPREKPWGQTVAYVRDPDGVLVEICSPMGSLVGEIKISVDPIGVNLWVCLAK